MQEIESGNFAVPRWLFCPPDSIRVVNWNIDRGSKLRGVIEFLAADELCLWTGVPGINPGLQEVARLPRPSNTFALAVVQFPSHSISEAIAFLASALVSSRDRALSGEARRTPGAGQRDQHRGQNNNDLQPAPGEQRR